MIDIRNVRVWTPFGYLPVNELYVGEKVISFNPDRGVCEYDTIQGIQIEYTKCMGLGVSSKSVRQVLTPDHPLLMWDSSRKQLQYRPIEDRFMINMLRVHTVNLLAHAVFEPYLVSQNEEDIKWSARMAASIANHKRAKLNVGSILDNLGGYESQLWIDTFFHWNKMLSGRNWMGTVWATNKEVVDAVFNIGPRAGVGIKWYPRNASYVISVTTNGLVSPMSPSGWFKNPLDGLVFNVTTRNGNVLIKCVKGTSLVACNKGD
jgi:hypothetical protein